MNRFGPALFAVTAAVLLAALAVLPATGFFSADSGPKYWQCLAIAEPEGSAPGFAYPASDLDPERRHIPPFTAPVGDRLASIYPVMFPVIAAVPQAVAGDRAMRLLPWLGALLAAALTGRIAGVLRSETLSWRAATLALAATPLAFYSIAFWEHSLAAAAVLGGLALVVRRDGLAAGHGWRWTALGVAIGLGAWIRTEVVFVAPVLAVAAAWGRGGAGGRGSRYLVGCGVGLAAGAALQRALLGSWLPLHVTYHVDSSFTRLPLLASRLESMVAFVAPHWSCGLAAAVWLGALAVTISRTGSRSRVGQLAGIAAVAASVVAATVVPAARWLSGLRPTDAFPVWAPAATWVVLSALPLLLWGQPRVVVRDRGRLLLVAVAAWSIVAVFVARPVRSFEWGGRLFLTAVLLLLAVAASLSVVEGPWRRLRRAACATAVVTAVLVQALGLVLLRHGATTHQGIAVEVLAGTEPGEPIVTDAYMVPLLSGRGWWTRRFLYATSDAGVSRLAAACAHERLDRWTWATLDGTRAGLRQAGGPAVVGTDGSRWRAAQRLDRTVGSERLVLVRYRRDGPAARAPAAADPRATR